VGTSRQNTRETCEVARRLTAKWSRRACCPVRSCRQGARLIWRVRPLSQEHGEWEDGKPSTLAGHKYNRHSVAQDPKRPLRAEPHPGSEFWVNRSLTIAGSPRNWAAQRAASAESGKGGEHRLSFDSQWKCDHGSDGRHVEFAKHDQVEGIVEASNYGVRIRRLPKHVSWLLLSLLANTAFLVLAPTDSLTAARGTVLVTVGVVGVLVFLGLSARGHWRTREFVGLPGVR
jgi:hypothetical protein